MYSDLDAIEQEETADGTTTFCEEIYIRFINYFKAKELIIFWRLLYTFVLLLIFAERAYYYR